MPERSLLVIACLLSILVLSGSTGMRAVQADSSRTKLDEAQDRLTDARWTLVSSRMRVESESKKASTRDSRGMAERKLYKMQLDRQLARVNALEWRLRSAVSSSDRETMLELLEQIDGVHRTALVLSASGTSNRQAGGATSSCYGSIAGTVAGPTGPLDGILVAAYTAEGITAGSALTEFDGSYQIDDLLVGEDLYLITSNADALIDEVFDDMACPGGACDPTIGTPITVSAGTITSGYDFVLAAGGRIGGALVGQPGPVSLLLTTVNVFDASGELITSAVSDFFGDYLTETGLPAGTYHVVTANLFGYLDELYDDVPCPSGGSCDPTIGAAVEVTGANTTSGIDFELALGGNITGTITDNATSQPLGNVLVGIHDDSGQLIAFGASDASGGYSILSGLPTGSFFAATGNLDGFVDELYDDIPCTGGLCTITGGTEIAVTEGLTTPNIDFALSVGGTFSGTVTRAADGMGLADVFILAHTEAGDLVGTATTDGNGDYTLSNGLGTGSYRATTLNPFGLHDLLFDGQPCPGGACDVTIGAPIGVTLGLDTPAIDFALSGDAIGSCDFEVCSTCGWTVVP